jgi:predicted PurR-regulated permease PerM
MNTKSLDTLILRYVGFGLLMLAALVMLYMVRGALPVFVVGAVVAYALEPVLQKLEKRYGGRAKAVACVFILFLLVLALLLSLAAAGVQQAQSLVSNIGTYSDQLSAMVESNRAKLDESKLPFAVKQALSDAIDNGLSNFQKGATAKGPEIATATVTGIGAFLINTFLFVLVTLGLMLEAHRIKTRLLMLVPPMYRRDITDLSTSINELLGRYVRGQLIVCGTYAVLLTIALEILSRVYGMNYPLVVGPMAFPLYIMPYFGMAIITGMTGLTAYLTADQQIPCTIAAVGCCIGLNLFVDYGIAPRVLGKGVGLHPLMVIFAIYTGFYLGGPVGTIVAVPVFASLRVIAIYLFPQLAAPLPEDVEMGIVRGPQGVSQAAKDAAEVEKNV